MRHKILLAAWVLSASTAIAQSSFMGLTPGVNTRDDADKVLGKPLTTSSDFYATYAPPSGLSSVYITYGSESNYNDHIIDAIKVDLIKPVSRAALIQKLKLPEVADTRIAGSTRMIENFGGNALISLWYVGSDEASGINHIEYFSKHAAVMINNFHLMPANMTAEYNTNYYGGDYRNFAAGQDGVAACINACAREKECKGYTYVRYGAFNRADAWCWLKSTLAPKTQDACCISGIKK